MTGDKGNYKGMNIEKSPLKRVSDAMDQRIETRMADSAARSERWSPLLSPPRDPNDSSEAESEFSASRWAQSTYPAEKQPLRINHRNRIESGHWRPRRDRSRSFWTRRYAVEDSSFDSSSHWETISDSSSVWNDSGDSYESNQGSMVKLPGSEKSLFLKKTHDASPQALEEQTYSAPENVYPYRDLETNKRSLRLLILLAGSFHQDISCQLVHTAFDEPEFPPYEAISYTWGEPVKSHTIWINEYRFPVAANLYHALQHLRQDVPRYLWVDAVCLNQENINERNHQVKQMKAIYREASRVLVWLGVRHMYSDEALNFIPVLQNMRWDREVRGSVMRAYRVQTSLEATAQICRRPWWRRVWIIQEVASAKSKVFVHCGHTQWPWHAFVLGAQLMKKEREGPNLYDPQVPPTLFPIDVIDIITKLEGVRNATKREGMDLLELLEVTRGSQATDKRDHVYSVLGLAQSKSTVGLEMDYAKSTPQVYLDTARHLIQTRNDLSLFGSQQKHADGHLPSWVMDWSKPYQGIQLLCHGTPYRASKNTRASFKFLSNPALLEVQGVVLCTIRRLCDSTHLKLFPWDKYIEDNVTTTKLLPWDKWVERRKRISAKSLHRASRPNNLEHEKQPPPTTNYIELSAIYGSCNPINNTTSITDRARLKYNFVEAYWRTLIGDSTRDGEFPAPASYGRIFEVLHVRHEIAAENESFSPTGSTHILAIIRECYPNSSRDEWVSRLVALRNSSQKALREEEFQREKAMRAQYLADDEHVSDYLDEYSEPHGPLVSSEAVRSQYGSQSQHSDDELWLTDEEDSTHLAARAQLPFVPEVPWASKHIGAFTWDYDDRMKQVMRNRNLFYTSEGYLGLAPAGATDGDKVCVLLGCNTPVILREKDDETYELVGAGYLHGFMQGEALDMLERGEKKIEDIVLS